MTVSLLAEVVPDKLFGLPAHPLIVHVPVVLIPLAAFGALLALVVPRWRSWALPVTAVLAGAGLVGVQLALWSGENLEASGEEGDLIERHSHLAEQARPLVALFFVVAAAVAIVAWRSARSPQVAASDGPGTPPARTRARFATLLLPLCALSVVTGALATVWIVRTGHSGATSVWKGEGGDKEKGDRKAKDADGDQKDNGGSGPSADGDGDGD